MTPLQNIRVNVFGLTQTAFAAALALDQSTVAKWERGQRSPTTENMRRVRALARRMKIKWEDKWFFEAGSAKAQDSAQAGVR